MPKLNTIGNLGEVKLIKLIDEIIFQKQGTHLLKDDAFFFKINKNSDVETIVLNTDMFVASTDAPTQMNYFQMGYKSIVMNVSDLLVKGVNPTAVLISLGLPANLLITEYKSLIMGIVDCCNRYEIEYLGGDLNVAKEVIISPTVFGFKVSNKIIHRYGMNIGDLVIITDKFGLTGVGFEILLNRKSQIDEFAAFTKAIKSVLEPSVTGDVAFLLSDADLATASIDSSDGLAKSLKDLMLANPNRGFEINFDKNLIHEEAFQFSTKYNVPLEELIFSGGEEFIHIFTIRPESYQEVSDLLKSSGNSFYHIGSVIKEEKIYINKSKQKLELAFNGFEHFS